MLFSSKSNGVWLICDSYQIHKIITFPYLDLFKWLEYNHYTPRSSRIFVWIWYFFNSNCIFDTPLNNFSICPVDFVNYKMNCQYSLHSYIVKTSQQNELVNQRSLEALKNEFHIYSIYSMKLRFSCITK